MWAALHLAVMMASVDSSVGLNIQLGFMTPVSDCPACLASFYSAVRWINTNIAYLKGFTVIPSHEDSSTLTGTLGGAVRGPPHSRLPMATWV